MKSGIYCIVAGLVLMSCSSTTTTRSSSKNADEQYSEDLSVYRPEYPDIQNTADSQDKEDQISGNYPRPQYDVTRDVNMVLDSIDILREDVRYVDGFTIQVYSGTNSEEAKIARGKVYSLVSGSAPQLKYEEPTFKVKVGKYYSRLEAQKTYTIIKKRFPQAIIIPERIYIN